MQGAVKRKRHAPRRVAIGLMVFALGAASAFGQDDPNDPLRKFEKGVKNAQSQQPAPAPAPAPSSNNNSNSSNNNSNSSNNNGNNSSYSSGYSDSSSGNNDLAVELTQDFVNFSIQLIAEAGSLTLQRLFTTADPAIRRDPGDILIPFVRYDLSYQSVTSGIYAISNRLEVGFGPLGLLYEDYVFHNRATGSQLMIEKELFLWRMSSSRDFELDLGFGQSALMGLDRIPMGSFALPIKYKPTDSITLEFIPTWSGLMTDYDGAVHWSNPSWSLKAGYRYLTTTGANLKGPYVGLALYF